MQNSPAVAPCIKLFVAVANPNTNLCVPPDPALSILIDGALAPTICKWLSAVALLTTNLPLAVVWVPTKVCPVDLTIKSGESINTPASLYLRIAKSAPVSDPLSTPSTRNAQRGKFPVLNEKIRGIPAFASKTNLLVLAPANKLIFPVVSKPPLGATTKPSEARILKFSVVPTEL